ncbi:hypothetical protein Cgig2_019952 [Carnegiea gigantea]|uniref:UDP-glycosyltransferase n=1 Tax=Carnegiea gigantea TaxID=171969 RepID=A0A9Q1JNR5_9CARY|nr:hypothetical protein Cgig2_019952 [Carnegiea gigantea]
MIHLANVLHSKGFSIIIIHTRFNSPDPFKFPNFIFHLIEDALWKVKDPPSDVIRILHDLNASYLDPFRACLSQMMDASKAKEPVACLILDPFWNFTATVAEEFNLPRITLRTGGILAFLIQGIIYNTFKELEGPDLNRVQQIGPSIPVFPIGPLHKYPSSNDSIIVMHDQNYLTWLSAQAPNSVLYVSFGTVAVISKEQLMEVAWGLEKSEQLFLWVIQPKSTDGLEDNVSLPEDFLRVAGRDHIVQWGGQQQVLAHRSVGGFWTHCGWNSTLESIFEGVPMICFPVLGDQKVNARKISDTWRINLHLKGRWRDKK